MVAARVGILDSLIPIFLMVALGAILTRRGFFSADFLKGLSSLAYYVGMPGLLFVSVSNAPALDERPLQIALVVFSASVAALLAGFVVARVLRLKPASVGTFVQSCFRCNLAFVGVPVAIYFFAGPDAPAPAAEMIPVAAVAIAPVMIAYNVLAVVVLIAGHTKPSRASLMLVAKRVVTNPLVLSVGAGLLASEFSIRLPTALVDALRTIGGVAVPAALFGVGGTVALAPFTEHLRPALGATVLKIVFMPFVGWWVARLLGLSPLDAALATMLCATPTATVSFIMSTQLRGDPELAASSIALSTMLSAVALAITLALFP